MTSRGGRSAAFRFDFGGPTGWGHLARCAALAAELSGRGWHCIAWTGGDLASVPADLARPFGRRLPLDADAHELIARCHWIVVDRYHDDDDSLRSLRQSFPQSRILVIDDEATRSLAAADLVLNSRLGLEHSLYASGVRALLGERYVLLRGGLSSPAKIDVPANAVPVLVILGGTDPLHLTAQTLEGLADVLADRVTPVVVHSQGGRDAAGIEAALERFKSSTWLEAIDAALLAAWARVCRFAVTACGGTVYELAFLRVPFAGLIVAENQRPLAREITRRWQLPVLEPGARLRQEIARAATSLLGTPGRSWTDLAAIDGRGAARVADAIETGL